MIKAEAEAILRGAVEDFIDVCPHCQARVHLKSTYLDSYKEKNRDLVFHVLFRCVPCKALALESFRFRQNQFDDNENYTVVGWEDKFPTEELVAMEKFNGVVPETVFSDFKEGSVSLKNKCYKAATGMFRRALQSSLLDLGADPTLELIDQIKNLPSLTTDLKDWAHNIRIFGNWGAHPQDDLLKEVTPERAEEAQAFLEEFFNYVYVMPTRVAKARPKVEEKNAKQNQEVSP